MMSQPISAIQKAHDDLLTAWANWAEQQTDESRLEKELAYKQWRSLVEQKLAERQSGRR